ncbi:MAG: hypothetical protein Q9171_007087 [Xanthocarpia ochracea]
MSFGWSVSDIALLVRLAYKTTQGARAACGQYDELTRETSSLHIVLNRLQTEIAKPESSINRQPSYGRELLSISTGCEEVLTQLDKVLVKYNALSEQERSIHRLWKKIRFGNGAIVDVADLRSRITSYTSTLSFFLNLVSAGAVGDVEKKMNQAGGDLQDIKAAVNNITAHLLSKEGQEGSVLTAYTNDDRGAWRELRRGLVKAGFRGSLVRKHMDTIMAYMKELGDRGVLDDIADEKSASPLLKREVKIPSAIGASGHSNVPSPSLDGQLGGEFERGWKPGSSETGQSATKDSETTLLNPTIPSGKELVRYSGEVKSIESLSTAARKAVKSGLRARQHDSQTTSNSTHAASDTGLEKDMDLSETLDSILSGNPNIDHYTDLFSARTLRYYSSTTTESPLESGLIMLNTFHFPAFIASEFTIYSMDMATEIRTSIEIKETPHRILLSEIVQDLRDRIFDSSMHETAVDTVPTYARDVSTTTGLLTRAVDIMLASKQAKSSTVTDPKPVQMLDYRQITTLCSIFAADYFHALDLATVSPHILNNLNVDIVRWFRDFDDRFPEVPVQPNRIRISHTSPNRRSSPLLPRRYVAYTAMGIMGLVLVRGLSHK